MKHLFFILPLLALSLSAQEPPYDVYPDAEPPYYRVRYEGSEETGKLRFPVKYTVWIPEEVETLRGLIVHQHGCGEGSCKSGLTGAFDLHWQALAKAHGCALMAPSYEQPQDAECQLWCDPRNGSGDAFMKSLKDLGNMSGHPELASVPWALWGHSGGGHWCGGMTLLYPERVAAVWLRSGVPLLEKNESRPSIQTYSVPEAALGVPIMCNPGTEEGVTVKKGRFAGVWPANEAFFYPVRAKGGLIGIAVDPLTSHQCGNQRYMAIPWLDHFLTARLPEKNGEALEPMPTDRAWLAPVLGEKAVPATEYQGDTTTAVWLPNGSIAKKWMTYVKDTNVADPTPPPAPTDLKVDGNTLTWNAEADPESGIAYFIVKRNGEKIAEVGQAKNSFGRRLFQGLQYSDTPLLPLVAMEFVDKEATGGGAHDYEVISVNTVGLTSDAGDWVVLFDGNSLKGWEATSDANWRVEEGAIVVDGGEKGFLLHEDTYTNYELEIEFKAAKGTNSGVFLSTKPSPEELTKDCYELNIAPPDNPFPTGSLVARAKVEGAGETDTWRRYEVRVQDSQVIVHLDGEKVLSYEAQSPSEGNRIGLQRNSGRVAFRNIRVRKL